MTNKTIPTPSDVNAFLQAIPDLQRRADAQTLAALMQEATSIAPVMWGSSIIGFGLRHYKYESGRGGDTVIVGFAPRKQALALYGLAHYSGQHPDLVAQLGPHTTGKGCLYIKRLADINTAALNELVKGAYESTPSTDQGVATGAS